MDRTVMFDWDPIFIAAGALTGLRVSASMLLGGTLCWGVFVPILQHHGVIATDRQRYRDVVSWTLWGGVSCMVTSGLLSFALQWRSMVRAFGSLGELFSRASATAERNGRDRNAALVVHCRATRRADRPCPVGLCDFRHAVLAERSGGRAVVLPGPGGLPRHGRNRHDAHRRDGQSHATFLRRHQPAAT